MAWRVAVAFLCSFLALRAVEKMGEALRETQVPGLHWACQPPLDVVVPGMWGKVRQAGGANWVDDAPCWRQAILFLSPSQGCARHVHGDDLFRMSGCC